jgi:hypothetical protein
MPLSDVVRHLRSWVPVPTGGWRIELGRWILLEANRYAVSGALLTVTFVSILTVGTVWTFELQRLLTETQAVQTVLGSFLSGIILLVSIVVSINAIVLSYDITHLSAQEDRIEATLEFRRELGRLSDAGENPTNPNAFLQVMADTIRRRAEALEELADGAQEEFAEDIVRYVESVSETASVLEGELDQVGGAEFGVLWLGLEADYGPFIDRSRKLASRYREDNQKADEDLFGELVESLELFATGREYFKTLYYSKEISELSQTLLVISLPAIIITSTTILAIDARLLPDLWLFGLSPLLTFVAITFTVALAPFIVLMAYMLRLATVARRTAGPGPFTLQS